MSEQKYWPGDVFLFESDGSNVSELICELTKSRISHAAMFYSDEMGIVEQALSGISHRTLDRLEPGRVIHIMSYKRQAESQADLIKSADRFLAEGVKYSLGSLFMIGFLLVGDRRIGAKIPLPAKALLAFICGLVADAIDKKTQNGVKSLTCSQLVYEIYDKAGHTLHMDKFLLESGPLSRDFDGPAPGQSLLDQSLALARTMEAGGPASEGRRAAGLAQAAAFSWVKNKAAAWADQHKYEVFDYLCGALLKWLRQDQTTTTRGPAAAGPATDGAELFDGPSLALEEAELREFFNSLSASGDSEAAALEDVGQFALLVQDLGAEGGSASRGLGDISGRLQKALAELKKMYSHYVTPEDLFNNCLELRESSRLN